MSRNPVLTDSAFGASGTTGRPSPADEWAAAQAAGAASAAAPVSAPATPSIPTATVGRAMTIGGVASATLVMFAVLLVGAWYGWTLVTETPILNPLPDGPTATATIDSPLIVWGSLLAAFVLVLVSTFKPPLARFTGVLYAGLEGIVLGAISHVYNAQFDGIVAQAIICTFGVFLAMMVLYGLRILRATPRFVKGVIAATFGIALLYIGSMIWSIFFTTPSFMVSSSPLSIGISVVIVIVAAMNLILDFDFIEQGSKRGLPAYMDWYAALGLMVTLVWLYLEMLRLLAKVRQ